MKKLLVILLLSGLGYGQTIIRPTTNADDTNLVCGTARLTSADMAAAYNVNNPPPDTTTTATISGAADAANDTQRTRVFSGWTGTANSGATLNIHSYCNLVSNGAGICMAQISTNSGISWSLFNTTSVDAGTTLSTQSGSVAAGTNLANVRVRICTTGTYTDTSVTTTYGISDIWISNPTGTTGKRIILVN